MLQIAGMMLAVDPDDLEYSNRPVYVKASEDGPDDMVGAGAAESPNETEDGPARGTRRSIEGSASIEAVVMHGHFVEGGPIIGKGWYFYSEAPRDPNVRYEGFAFAPFPTFIFAAQAAEVVVDLETGEVELVKFTSAHDVGRAINPRNCEGQIEGALATGLGYATSEEVVVDAAGVVVNAQLLDYKLPCALDMPRDVVSIIVEGADPKGPFGAKGVGEPALVPTAPAIAAAIYDAIGVQIRDLPITSEKVLMACRPPR